MNKKKVVITKNTRKSIAEQNHQRIQDALKAKNTPKNFVVKKTNLVGVGAMTRHKKLPLTGNTKKPEKVDFESQQRAINCVEIATPNWFRNDGPVDVSIIVPMFRSHEVIKDQIKSWQLNDNISKEIIYVDDNCPFKSFQSVLDTWEKRLGDFETPIGKIIKNNQNGGFAEACNAGAKYASGQYLVFLNADCTVTENWLQPLLNAFNLGDVGIVGNIQLRPDGVVLSAGSEWFHGYFAHVGFEVYKRQKLVKPLTMENLPNDLKELREVEMTTGCCFAIEKKLFNAVGGFDTNYKIGYWEDTDLNMKVQMRGKKVYVQPESIIYHKIGHSGAGGHGYLTRNRDRFYEKWVDTKAIEMFVNNKNSKIDQTKTVVYTSICGEYDDLSDKQIQDGTQFIAFMDNGVESKIWDILPVHKEFKDANRNAKIHKVLSHKYFPDKEYSLWIDGSVELLAPSFKIIETFIKDYDIVVFKHPQRKCIYDEAAVCIERKLDFKDVIEKQIRRYQHENYPAKNGLVEATILLRRHNSRVAEFNEMWWREICKGSKRDQISFNYVASKMGVKIGYFHGSLRKTQNALFHKREHNRTR